MRNDADRRFGFFFLNLVIEHSLQHGMIQDRNIMQHFNPIVQHFHYQMVLNKHLIPKAINILLIIIINKLIGKILDLVSSFISFEMHCSSK